MAVRATSFSTKAAAADLRNNTTAEHAIEQSHRRNFTQQLAQRAQQEQALAQVPKAFKQRWVNTTKGQGLTQGPAHEKLKYMYSTIDAQGDADAHLCQDRTDFPSMNGFRHVDPRTKSEFQDQSTAFGFPTIHAQSKESKRRIWTKAGVPGDNSGIHTTVLENEKLLPKQNYLQNCYQMCKGQIRAEKMSTEPPAKVKEESKEDMHPGQKPRNEIQRINGGMEQNRAAFGARNGHVQFSKLE